jgi:steroid delta-isomerase-like uncharacterized protein
MAAYGALDRDTLLTTFADDAVLRDMADPDNPFSGKDAIREFLDEYFAALTDVEVEIVSTVADAETVAGELEVNATYVGAPFSHGNGRKVVMRYCVVDTVHDGKVVYERFYWDRTEFERQLA